MKSVLGLTIGEAAAQLWIEESALLAVCIGESPINADLAIRFEHAFGSTADTCLRLQNAHSLVPAAGQSASSNGSNGRLDGIDLLDLPSRLISVPNEWFPRGGIHNTI